jgi:hypothetical protein
MDLFGKYLKGIRPNKCKFTAQSNLNILFNCDALQLKTTYQFTLPPTAKFLPGAEMPEAKVR